MLWKPGGPPVLGRYRPANQSEWERAHVHLACVLTSPRVELCIE
jgi:hypothetical protein